MRVKEAEGMILDALLIAWVALMIGAYVRANPALRAEIERRRREIEADVRRIVDGLPRPVCDEDVFSAHEHLKRMTTLAQALR